MGRCFAENRHMVFIWKLPGKRACDVLLEQDLRGYFAEADLREDVFLRLTLERIPESA